MARHSYQEDVVRLISCGGKASLFDREYDCKLAGLRVMRLSIDSIGIFKSMRQCQLFVIYFNAANGHY